MRGTPFEVRDLLVTAYCLWPTAYCLLPTDPSIVPFGYLELHHLCHSDQ